LEQYLSLITLRIPVKIYRLIYFLLFATLIVSCKTSSESINEDLDEMCDIMSKINSSDVDSSTKSSIFIQKLQEKKLSSETKQFIYESTMKSSLSFSDFQDFAISNGVTDWKCKSIEDFFK